MLTDLKCFHVSFGEETGFAISNDCTIPPIPTGLRWIGEKKKVLLKSCANK
jgi:hypothetical protein